MTIGDSHQGSDSQHRLSDQISANTAEQPDDPSRAGLPACLGILRLARQYGADRLEAACDRGLDIGTRSYGSIQSILKHGLDKRPGPCRPAGRVAPRPPQHPRLPLLPLRRLDRADPPHPRPDAPARARRHARAFTELEANPQSADLSHAEWLALLLDREATDRYERRLRARLRIPVNVISHSG